MKAPAAMIPITRDTEGVLRSRRKPFDSDRGGDYDHYAEIHYTGHEQHHHETGAAQTAVRAQKVAVLPGTPGVRR